MQYGLRFCCGSPWEECACYLYVLMQYMLRRTAVRTSVLTCVELKRRTLTTISNRISSRIVYMCVCRRPATPNSGRQELQSHAWRILAPYLLVTSRECTCIFFLHMQSYYARRISSLHSLLITNQNCSWQTEVPNCVSVDWKKHVSE